MMHHPFLFLVFLAGPSPDDWILEELWHDDQLFLMDRKTGKLFSVATSGSFPRPAGTCQLGWEQGGGVEKDRFRGGGLLIRVSDANHLVL
jgi:hypothetical protein